MSDAFIQSLQITVLGMGLVFGAILLLWLMMVLLTTFTADKKTHLDEAPASDFASSLILLPRQGSNLKLPRSLWQLPLQNKVNPQPAR